MTMITRARIYIIGIATMILGACSNEMPQSAIEQSGFLLSLNEPSVEVTETRSLPSELGVPTSEKFQLRVENSNTHIITYDGRYLPFIEAGKGDYTITATCGEDLAIALDKPYYVGSENASIVEKGDKPEVSITCRLANALASVYYYDSEGNPSTARFDETFAEYGVQVWRDEQYVVMRNGMSAYFRTGTTPRFIFVGTMKDGGQQVYYELSQDKFPATVEAARHIIIKMSMQKTPSGIDIYDDVADDVSQFDGFDSCL